MSTNLSTAAAVLALGKTAGRVAASLSTLSDHIDIFGFRIEDLARDVKALGIECDLTYATLDEAVVQGQTAMATKQDVETRLWACLGLHIEETAGSLRELQMFVNTVREEQTRRNTPSQTPRRLDLCEERVRSLRTRLTRHVDNFRMTLFLIDAVLSQTAYPRAEQQSLDDRNKLQDLMEKLQIASTSDSKSHLATIEAAILNLGHDLAMQNRLAIGENVQSKYIAARRPPMKLSFVTQWKKWLDALRQDNQQLEQAKRGFSVASTLIDGVHLTTLDIDPTLILVRHEEESSRTSEDSDNDLETDLAKAALDTGAEAFGSLEWRDAESLLVEALRILQGLSMKQRRFCDIPTLHYQLAICAYKTRHPVEAEEALQSLVEQPQKTERQAANILEASHLLAQVYIKLGKVDNAKTSCEKALQGRRRLLGKQSDPALESLALMSHIYVLQENRALAKSCLSIIPEERRETILATVEASIGPTVEHLDFASLLRPPGPVPKPPSKSPARRHERSESSQPVDELPLLPDMRFLTIRSASPTASVHSTSTTETRLPLDAFLQETSTSTPSLSASSFPNHDTSAASILARKAILDKVGCHPRDRIEEAVCASDIGTLISHLTKKKPFWRSGPRRRGRSERVTALHFAALFGEVDMADRLLDAGYNINDVPFGYSTPLSPIHFAIGARQVEMVKFLIERGAKPQEPDSWATLASQLLSRAWLRKTMTEEDRDAVPAKIVDIMYILLKAGWKINGPIDHLGKTVLHQAASFSTGAQEWDLQVKKAVTEFLCENGGNLKRADDDKASLSSGNTGSKGWRHNEAALAELM